MAEAETIKLLDVDKLHPSPFNPRKDFAAAELAELAESIKQKGVLEPLLAREISERGAWRIELVAGERRWRAAKKAGLARVPVIVRELSDVEAREIQIVENLQRAGITPLEEAQAYQDLLKAANSANGAAPPAGEAGNVKKLDVKGLAARVGKSERFVYARLELLKLSAPVQRALAAEKLSPSMAAELVPLKPEQQKEMLAEVWNEWNPITSVQDLRDVIKDKYEPKKKPVVSKVEAARRKKWRDEEAKRQARYAAEQKRDARERELRREVDAKALPLLWAALKGANKKAQALILDQFVAAAGAHEGHLGDAQRIAAGRPLERNGWIRADQKAFRRQPLATRLALLVLADAIDTSGYQPKRADELYRWAKIDVRKIRAQILAAEAAKAKPLPTSAKPKPAKRNAKK